MMDDKAIRQTMEKRDLLCPLLNYLFNLTRRPKAKALDYMKQIAGDKTYQTIKGDKTLHHVYSCIATDQDFYQNITDNLGCSKATVKRYIRSLIKMNALIQINTLEHQIPVIADGYFLEYENGYSKKSLLKKNSFFVKKLRNFEMER